MPKQTTWGRAADVVVVGYGAAGAAAAIAARDSGAEVLIIEKQDESSHISNSAMSGGIFVSPDNVPDAIRYMESIASAPAGLQWTDGDTLRAFVEYAVRNKAWLEALGARVDVFKKGGEHDGPGTESITAYWTRGLGYGLMRLLKSQVQKRDITVIYGSPADKLLTDTRGEVVGVRGIAGGVPYRVRARRAVIMATGGFEFNEEMKLNYLKVYPAYFAGSPANTGDGIRMVQELGASLWHMNCCSAAVVLKVPEFPIALGVNFGGRQGFSQNVHHIVRESPCGYIIVDRDGRRFTSEEVKWHTIYYELGLYDSQGLRYPRIPSYWIFDRKRIESGPLPRNYYGPLLHRLFRWSADNQEEVRKGWIIRADNVRELAARLGMEPAVLESTVADYNGCCGQKRDPVFQRRAHTLVPLVDPPFFAIELWPGSANTQGGPRRNHRAQVINVAGNPIPRLYAAGELGSVFGMLYPAGGGNLAECFAFGRIAGENAAREPRRTR